MTKISGQDRPVTIDAVTGRPDPTPTIHLKTADDIRLEMAKVYREMRSGKLDSAEGTKLVYVLGQIGKTIESAKLSAIVEAAPAVEAPTDLSCLTNEELEALIAIQRKLGVGNGLPLCGVARYW